MPHLQPHFDSIYLLPVCEVNYRLLHLPFDCVDGAMGGLTDNSMSGSVGIGALAGTIGRARARRTSISMGSLEGGKLSDVGSLWQAPSRVRYSVWWMRCSCILWKCRADWSWSRVCSGRAWVSIDPSASSCLALVMEGSFSRPTSVGIGASSNGILTLIVPLCFSHSRRSLLRRVALLGCPLHQKNEMRGPTGAVWPDDSSWRRQGRAKRVQERDRAL